MSAPETLLQRPLGPRPIKRPQPGLHGSPCLCRERPPVPRPLSLGADLKLSKGLAGGGRDAGREGPSLRAGQFLHSWIGIGTFPWEETLKAAQGGGGGKEEGSKKREKKRGEGEK